jgi:hypothetical protein
MRVTPNLSQRRVSVDFRKIVNLLDLGSSTGIGGLQKQQ